MLLALRPWCGNWLRWIFQRANPDYEISWIVVTELPIREQHQAGSKYMDEQVQGGKNLNQNLTQTQLATSQSAGW